MKKVINALKLENIGGVSFLIVVALLFFIRPLEAMDNPNSRAEKENYSLQDPPAQSAPEAIFKNGKGEEVRISELKGKVVFINFWATWCPPCRMEMPTIDKLYKQFEDNEDIVFLIVDADNKYEKSSKFASKKNYSFPIYVPVGDIPYDYFSGALPTTVMIDKKGNIVFRHAGAADYSDPKMVKFVKELVEEEV